MHNFLRFIYAKKFPELESLVLDPLQFARCVKRLEENGGEAQLNDILTPHLVVAVKIALGQARKKPLSPTDQANCLKAAEHLEWLLKEKERVGCVK
jgi:U4/U6 small nuclear ribonucleoprotein PRP31